MLDWAAAYHGSLSVMAVWYCIAARGGSGAWEVLSMIFVVEGGAPASNWLCHRTINTVTMCAIALSARRMDDQSLCVCVCVSVCVCWGGLLPLCASHSGTRPQRVACCIDSGIISSSKQAPQHAHAQD